MKSDEFKKRYETGPWGNIRVLDAKPSMGRNLLLAFLFYVVVGIFVAYITHEARAAGAAFGPVFQVAGAVGVASYCLAGFPHALWFGTSPGALDLGNSKGPRLNSSSFTRTRMPTAASTTSVVRITN